MTNDAFNSEEGRARLALLCKRAFERGDYRVEVINEDKGLNPEEEREIGRMFERGDYTVIEAGVEHLS